MENKNNNKGIIALLVVIIVILAVLCFLFATGTISLKSSTTNNNQQTSENTQTNTNENQQSNDNDYDAEAIAKEKMPTVLSLIKQESGVYTYCGNKGSSDLTKGNYYYSISKSYKTLNELKNYLNTVMTREIYDKYFLNGSDKYIEQDGNLYCSFAGADGLAIHFSSEESINKLENLNYQISNKTNNSFNAVMSFNYSSKVDGENNGTHTFNASFVKENGNWLINSFSE